MRGLPEQEAGQPLLAAGADHQVGVGLPAGVEVFGDVVGVEESRDLLEGRPLLGVFLQQPTDRISDLPPAAVADRDVDQQSRPVDGRLLGLHLSSIEKFWTNLVEALDDQALRDDPRFATRQGRIDDYLALAETLNTIFARRDRADWLDRLGQFDLPFAPLNSIEEAVNDPQAAHLGMVAPVIGRIEGAEEAIRAAFTIDGERDQGVGAAPVLDQHGRQIREAMMRDPATWPVRSREPVTPPRSDHHESFGSRSELSR